MNSKPWVLLAILLLILSLAAGCGAKNEPAETPSDQTRTGEIRVTDFRGEEVVLDQPAAKIACMLDSGLTSLHMLGVRDEVIALDTWTYENDGFQYTAKLDPRIGRKEVPAVTGNIEKLVALQPDIVIIWSGHEDIKQLEEHGLKVYGVQINRFDDIYKEIEDLGKITGREERAREIIAYTRQEINAVAERLAKLNDSVKVPAMFVWGPSKLDIAGAASTGNDILVQAGAENVAADLRQEHLVANMEQVVGWNPGAIVIWNSKTMEPEDYYSDSQWQTVKAVKDKRVFELPDFFFCDLWTLKYQYAIKASAKWLYPDLFADVDLEAEKNEMIKNLYGREL